jgi:primosomal protein N' (replication factor Y)
MEEDLYHTLSYAKKSRKPLFIQTYTPDHPLLQVLVEGNYKDFLLQMSSERKAFHYPPYEEFIQIRIHDPYKEKVQDILQKLLNKIQILKTDDVFLAYDLDLWEKNRGEWVQKIVLK